MFWKRKKRGRPAPLFGEEIQRGKEKNSILSLRKRTFVSFHWDDVFAFVQERKALTGVIVIGLIFLIVGAVSLTSRANIATFYPDSCLGGWEHPELAEGEPSVELGAGPEEFTKANSAYLRNKSADIFCGGFTGTIPQDTSPKKFMVAFSWSLDDGTISHNEPTPVKVTDDGEIIGEEGINAPEAQPEETIDTPSLPDEEIKEEEVHEESDEPAESSEDDTNDSTETESDSSGDEGSEPSAFLNFFAKHVFAEDESAPEETPAEQIVDEPVEEVVSEPSEEVNEQVEEEIGSTDEEVTEPEEMLTPDATEESVEENNEDIAPQIIEPSPNDFLEVRYTIDGSDWKTLGMVSSTDWQGASFEIVDSAVTDWDDLSHVQIQLHTLPSIDKAPVVYLDSMSISVEYEGLAALVDPPTVLLKDSATLLEGKTGFNPSEDIVFDLGDTNFTTEDLQTLIQEEKAEVIEDSAGVLDIEEKKKPDHLIEPPSIENLKHLVPPFLTNDNENASTGDVTSSEGGVLQEETSTQASDTEESDAGDATENGEDEVPPIEDDAPSQEEHSSDNDTSASNSDDGGGESEPAAFHFLPRIAEAFGGEPGDNIILTIYDVNGNPTDIPATVITVIQNGKEKRQIHIDKSGREFRPGRYRLRITITTPQAILVSEQDFTWGVLAINTDKSVYKPGDDAYLQMGVLDDYGTTICNASLTLKIAFPGGGSQTFRTGNNTIVSDPQCGPNNVIDVPDYYAHFPVPENTGVYTMTLSATTKNGSYTISDQFEVDASPAFDVTRSAPTRIFPIASYPATMRITSPTAWQGTVTEKVPANFDITSPHNSLPYTSTTSDGDTKTLTWYLSFAAGETKTIGYYFNAPDKSPEFYLIGPLGFTNSQGQEDFTETRKWQIASDGSCQTGAGTAGNWSAAGTWTGTCTGTGGKPGTGDTVTINSGYTVTMDENSAVLATLTITGTLNTSNGTSRNLSAANILVNGGTLTANASNITLSGTSGTLFDVTSGTFTAGTSQVRFSPDADATLTGANPIAFSSVNIAPTITANRAYSFGSGAITLSASMVINPDSAGANKLTVTMGGTISVAAAGTLTIQRQNSATSELDTNTSGFALSTGKLAINAGGELDANTSNITLTATSGVLFSKPGTFTYDTSTVIYTPDATINTAGTNILTDATNPITFYNLTLSPTLSAARTYLFGAAAVTVMNTMDSKPTATVTAARILTVSQGAAFTVGGSMIVEGVNSSGSGGNIGTTTWSTTASNFALTAGTVNIVQVSATNSVLTLNASTLTVNGTSGTLLSRSGTFTPGTSTVVINPDAAVTLTDASTWTFNNLTLSPTLTTDRAYTFGGGSISTSAFNINPSASSGTPRLTVTMGAALTAGATSTTTIQGSSGALSTLNTGTNFAFGTGFLSMTSAGTFTMNASAVTLSGTTGTLITFPGGTINSGTSTVSITGNGSNTINSAALTGSNKLNNLTINITGVTKTLGAALEMGGTTTVTLGTLNTSASGNYALTTGKISIANSASAILTVNASTVTLNGTTSTLITRGASGVFNQGTSNIVVSPASGTGIAFASGTLTLNRLTITSSATVINAGAALTFSNTDTSNGLFITQGVFNDGGNQIAGTTNGTLSVSAGATLCLGGSSAATNVTCNSSTTATTATTFPTNFTNANISLATTSTVIYAANAAQTVATNVSGTGPGTYGNLSFLPALATTAKAYTFAGGVNINGNFNVIPVSGAFVLTANLAGTTVVAGTTTIQSSTTASAGSNLVTNSNTFTSGTLVLGGSGVCASGTCKLTAGSSTVTLNGTSGTLATIGTNGVLTAGTSTFVMNPDADVTLTSGSFNASNSFNVLTLSPALTAPRTYSMGSGSVATTDNFNVSPSSGSFLLTVNLGSGFLVAATKTTTIQAPSGGSATLALGSNTLSTGFITIGGGTCSASSCTLSAGSGALTMTGTTAAATLMTLDTGGVFSGGTSTVTVNGNGSNVINSSGFTGTNKLYNLTINITGVTKTLGAPLVVDNLTTVTLGTLDTDNTNNYSLSTGSISIANSAAAIMNIRASSLLVTGTTGTLITRGSSGVFTAGTSSTVNLTGNGTAIINSGSLSVYNLTSSGTGTKSISTTASQAITLATGGTLSVTDGILLSDGTNAFTSGGTNPLSVGPSGTIQVGATTFAGSYSGFDSYTFTAGSIVEYSRAGAQTVASTASLNATSYADLKISGSGIKSEIADVSATGTTQVTAGTLDTAGFGLTTAQLSFTGGTLTAGSSTITLTGTTGTPLSYTSGTFTAGTSTVVYSGNNGGGNTTISNAVTYNNLTVNNSSETYVLAGTTTLAGITTITNGILDTTGSNYALNTGKIIMANAATAILTANGSVITLSGTSGTIFTRGAAAVFSGGTSRVVFSGDGDITMFSADMTVATSSALYNLELAPALGASRAYTGGAAVAATNNILVDPTGGSSRTLTYTLGGTNTISGTLSISPGAASTNATVSTSGSNFGITAGALTTASGGTLIANGSTITISGSVTNAGTITAGTSSIFIGGNWTNTGTFTANTSTVTFNTGTTATISGTTTFNNLTITHTAAKEVDFATSGTPIFNVTGAFTVTGSSGNLIKLYSDSPGTQWEFNPTGTASVTYADVKDGGCQPTAITIFPSSSTDSGNNDSCWVFAFITFTIDDPAIGFGTLSTSTGRWATHDALGTNASDPALPTSATTMTAGTSASGGYTISYLGPTLTSGATTLAGNTTIAGGGDSDGTQNSEEFGISVTASCGSGCVASAYRRGTNSKWRFTANTLNNIVQENAAAAGTTIDISYLANISDTTSAGEYATTVTYIMTGNF